tara:strand:+ start:496 stop:1779 length:1284 start_codon:yes stop_codon:yes gene_type:complete
MHPLGERLNKLVIAPSLSTSLDTAHLVEVHCSDTSVTSWLLSTLKETGAVLLHMEQMAIIYPGSGYGLAAHWYFADANTITVMRSLIQKAKRVVFSDVFTDKETFKDTSTFLSTATQVATLSDITFTHLDGALHRSVTTPDEAAAFMKHRVDNHRFSVAHRLIAQRQCDHINAQIAQQHSFAARCNNVATLICEGFISFPIDAVLDIMSAMLPWCTQEMTSLLGDGGNNSDMWILLNAYRQHVFNDDNSLGLDVSFAPTEVVTRLFLPTLPKEVDDAIEVLTKDITVSVEPLMTGAFKTPFIGMLSAGYENFSAHLLSAMRTIHAHNESQRHAQYGAEMLSSTLNFEVRAGGSNAAPKQRETVKEVIKRLMVNTLVDIIRMARQCDAHAAVCYSLFEQGADGNQEPKAQFHALIEELHAISNRRYGC